MSLTPLLSMRAKDSKPTKIMYARYVPSLCLCIVEFFVRASFLRKIPKLMNPGKLSWNALRMLHDDETLQVDHGIQVFEGRGIVLMHRIYCAVSFTGNTGLGVRSKNPSRNTTD